MATPRSLTDIINSLISSIAAKIPGISTRTGTVVRDVVIEAPAQEFSNSYIEISNAEDLTSLQNYNSFTTDELNSIASDYGLTRLLGVAATGTVIFRFRTLSDVSIPFGTKLTTLASANNIGVSFVTSQAIAIAQSDLPTYYNYVTSFYEVPVIVESSNVGTDNNVAAGTITNVISSVSNLDSVTNYLPTTGGTGDESNLLLAARIQVKREGNNIGTKSGYENVVNTDNRVIDSIVVSPNDVEMKRNEFGGSVDIYILGTALTGVIETQNWITGTTELIMLHQPVHSVASVTGSTNGILALNTDYTFGQDTSLYTKSSGSQDKIIFTATGLSKLVNGDVVTINYSYNKIIEDLQAIVDADTDHIMAADILIRESTEVLVDVSMNVTALSGYNKTNVMNDVITVITDNINSLMLNGDLQRSDLVAWAYEVAGVDKTDLNTLIPAADVIADRTEYLRAGTISVVVA